MTSRPHGGRLFSEIGIQAPPAEMGVRNGLSLRCKTVAECAVGWGGAQKAGLGPSALRTPLKAYRAAPAAPPPDPAGLFSDDGEVTKFRIEGSLTIPITGIIGRLYF